MKAKFLAKEKAVYVNGRLLRPVRRVALRASKQELTVKEESLRTFWGRWDEEINVLQFKIDPLLHKILKSSNNPRLSKHPTSRPLSAPGSRFKVH